MTTKIKIAAGAALLAFLFGGMLYIKALRADNLRLSEAAALAKRQAEAYQLELREGREALAAREASLKILAAETANLKNELEDLYEKDIEAGAWAAGRLPDSVLDRLRRP